MINLESINFLVPILGRLFEANLDKEATNVDIKVKKMSLASSESEEDWTHYNDDFYTGSQPSSYSMGYQEWGLRGNKLP